MISACSSPIQSFEDTIESATENEFIVNCSDEVNRGKNGSIDDIGYMCRIGIDSSTQFKDQEGKPLQMADFSQGDLIRITLATPQNISEDNRSFAAQEIVLLNGQ